MNMHIFNEYIWKSVYREGHKNIPESLVDILEMLQIRRQRQQP